VRVVISNGYNTTERLWLVHVMESTDVESLENIPDKYSLEQNYPNPFNPVTRIKFSLPQAEFVELKVYDILGNEIALIVNEFKAAGYHEVSFKSTSLPSGLYFYSIQAGGNSFVKKMLLLK
jgi:hypothetical protein